MKSDTATVDAYLAECLRGRRVAAVVTGALGGDRQDARQGKSSLRFRKLDDLALDVLGEAIARTSVEDFIAAYERSRGTR